MFAAAIAAFWRVLVLVLLFNDPTLPSQALALLTSGSADPSKAAVLFFLIDLIGLSLSCAYFVLVEDGPWVALCVITGGLMWGPALSFALYCAYREISIAKAIMSVPQPEQAARAA